MKDIVQKILKFKKDRNWDQFHTGSNLAKSISIEAGELLELFQWNEETKKIQALEDELADVFIYAIMLSEKYGFNIKKIILNKIDKNEKKYPVEKAFGKSNKYDDL